MKTCEFSIDTNVLKKAVSLIGAVLPKKLEDSGFVLFEVSEGKCCLTACSSGNYLKQILDVNKVNQEGKFAIQIESLTKIKYPGKEIIFSVNNNLIVFKSGNLAGELAFVVSNNKIEANIPKEIIELTHEFSYNSFVNGLKLISFPPIQDGFDRKIVMINIKDGQLVLSTNDSHRGACFKSSITDSDDLNLIVDFTSIMSLLSSFKKDSTIKFGATKKLVRVYGSSLDYQFPFLTGNVRDMEVTLKQLVCGEPEYSFCIDAREFRKALDSACCVVGLSKTKEVKLNLKMKKGKEVKKSVEDKDMIKIAASTKVARTEYSLPVDNLIKEGIASTTNKVLKGILVMDGFIKLSFYNKILLLESINDDLKFVLPRLQDKV